MAKPVKITKRTCTIHGWPYDKTKAREGKLYAELERIDAALPSVEKQLFRIVAKLQEMKQRRARLIKRIEKPAEPTFAETLVAKTKGVEPGFNDPLPPMASATDQPAGR